MVTSAPGAVLTVKVCFMPDLDFSGAEIATLSFAEASSTLSETTPCATVSGIDISPDLRNAVASM